MVRIGNKEIPDKKNIAVALTYVYGIGMSRAREIINKTKIVGQKKTRDLTEGEIKLINEEIKHFPTEGELKEKIQKNINEQIRLGTYSGLRRIHKPNPLPIHGQRTRHNAQTAKKGGAATRKRLAVAGKKKAPTAK